MIIRAKELGFKDFKAVDDHDLVSILETMHPDCLFRVETHSVQLNGQKEIEQMFRRLWRNHKSVKHENFYFIEDDRTGSVAVRCNVVNSLSYGKLSFQSYGNFVTLDNT